MNEPRVAALVLGVLFAAAIVPIAVRPTWDIDAWWIAAAGRLTAATGHVPHTNVFSFTEPNHPWIFHEWLYGALFAWALAKLGPACFALIAMLGAWTVLGLVLVETMGRARHAPSALVLSAVVVLGSIDKLDSPRPLYLSIAFALAMTHLAFRPRMSWLAAAAAVAIELVWTNAHGSFPLGIALLVAGALDARAARMAARVAARGGGEPPPSAWPRIASLVGAVAVTLANPYGLRLYAVVARYTIASDAASVLIRSTLSGFLPLWRAPWTFVDAPLVLALAGMAGLAVLSLRHPPPSTSRIRPLVSLVLCALAVLHVRNLVLAITVSAVLLAPSVQARWAPAPAPVAATPPREIARRLALALVIPLVAGLVAFGATLRVRPADAWIGPFLGGPSFVRLAGDLPAGAHVFVPFRSTGLLIWLAAPRGVRVMFDARNDCYSSELIQAGFELNMQTLSPEATRTAIERSGADHAIVDEHDLAFVALTSPTTTAPMATSRWSVTRRDGEWALLSSSGTPR